MGYVVVVFAIINAAALLAVGYYLRECWRELPEYVSTAIQDEVRKQDDRIEKRLAKAITPVGSDEGPVSIKDGIRAGVSVRRHA